MVTWLDAAKYGGQPYSRYEGSDRSCRNRRTEYVPEGTRPMLTAPLTATNARPLHVTFANTSMLVGPTVTPVLSTVAGPSQWKEKFAERSSALVGVGGLVEINKSGSDQATAT